MGFSTIGDRLTRLRSALPKYVTLVAVSKYHTPAEIMEAYAVGQRDFGENRSAELLSKAAALPDDIRWHFLGHLQRNKVKEVVGKVYLIQSVDSVRLLDAIEAEASRQGIRQRVLLEVHVAQEESKGGFAPEELVRLAKEHAFDRYKHVVLCGLMAMATNTPDEHRWSLDFHAVWSCFQLMIVHMPYHEYYNWRIRSMGMSNDYYYAIRQDSNMVRIGTEIFGPPTTNG